MADDLRVAALDPTGKRVTIPQSQVVDAEAQGYQVLSAERAAVLDAEAKYGGQDARTLLEGVGRGASLGASDVIQAKGANWGTSLGNYLADLTGEGVTQRATGRTVDSPVVDIDREAEAVAAEQEAKADILGRKTANADSALAGELVGGVGLGVATGGLWTSGLAARGATALGRAGYVAGAGAIEGAAFGGAAAANEDFLNDRELTAERILIGAGSGALLGGALGGGVSLLGSGLRAGAKKLAEKAGGGTVGGYLDKLAGDSAYKDVVGRTSKKAIKEADRFGGTDAVGKTLLEEGLVGGSAEEKLARISTRADEIGRELGDLVKQADNFAEAGPSRIGLRNAIREKVIDPLKSGTFSEDTARAVESKLQKMMDSLSRADSPVLVRGAKGARTLKRDAITFDELRSMRMELDNELANWNKLTAEQGPLKAYRDVRRVMEEYWMDNAEQAAQSAGRTGFKEEVQALKRKYSHLALARDQAQEAVETQLANRATSLTDTIAGAGTAGGIGGLEGLVSGIATSQAHRYLRERGRGMLANAIYSARQAAVDGEASINNSAMRLISSMGAKLKDHRPVGAVPIAGVVLIPDNPATITLASQKITALQDPTSQERAETRARFEDLAGEDPELAAAMEARVQTVADFLATKAPKTTFDLSTPFGRYDAPRYDKREAQSFARYVRAAQDPGAALERLASGEGAREDAETLKALHPKSWNRFVASAMTRLQDAKKKPAYSERLRLSALLGVPMTSFESQEFQQLIAATAGATDAAKAKAMRAPTTTQLARANADTSTRSEGIIARGE